MRYLPIALTLIASTALGQTTNTITLAGTSGETSLHVPKEPCDLVRTVNWTVANTNNLCSDLEFWLVAGSSCGDDRGTNDLLYKVEQSTLATTRTGQVTFKVSDLPAFNGTNAVSCPAEGREDEYRLCASLKLGTSVVGSVCSTTQAQKKDFEVVYDSKPPDSPGIEKVSPLDSALSVRVTVPTDANRLKVQVIRADGSGSARNFQQSSDQPLFRVEGLENGVAYAVTATALDAADNESAASAPVEGTPIHTLGFFDNYVGAGGQETGGCTAAGGLTGGGVMAVLAFWLSSRRKRS